MNLCVAQRELKLLDAALANCEQGARLTPTEAESWFNLGRVRYELHNVAGARDALAKAVSLKPEGFDENLQYRPDVDLNRRDRTKRCPTSRRPTICTRRTRT